MVVLTFFFSRMVILSCITSRRMVTRLDKCVIISAEIPAPFLTLFSSIGIIANALKRVSVASRSELVVGLESVQLQKNDRFLCNNVRCLVVDLHLSRGGQIYEAPLKIIIKSRKYGYANEKRNVRRRTPSEDRSSSSRGKFK
jgi:hypothetical protein